jgi:hypothetical protein
MRKAVAPTALAIVVMLAGCSGDGGAQGDRSPAAGGATPYIGGLTAPDLATGNGAVRGSTRAPVTAGVRSDGRFAQTRPIARPQTDGRRPAASPSASASGKPGTARPARPTRPTAGPTTGAATGAATPDSEPPTTSGAVTSGAAEQAETPPGTAAAHGMAESTVRFQEIEDAYADATRPLLQALAREPLDMAAVRQGVATATRGFATRTASLRAWRWPDAVQPRVDSYVALAATVGMGMLRNAAHSVRLEDLAAAAEVSQLQRLSDAEGKVRSALGLPPA